MDIHQNARLTPHGRAELVRRVLLEGQAPRAVAAALGVDVKTVSKWVERFQAEGAEGLLDRSSRPHRLRPPTPDATVEQIAALRRQRWTGDQIAKRSRLAGHRQPRPATARAEPAEGSGAGGADPTLRARPARRADPHRHQEARPLREDRPPHHRRARRPEPRRRLGVRPRLPRRRLAHRLRPGPARRAQGERDRLPASRPGLLCEPRRRRRPGHDRQWLLLPLQGLCQDLPAARAQAPQDQALHAQDQWQGRALHPVRPQGMGLRPGLSDLGHRTAELPAWLHRYNWHRPHGGYNHRRPSANSALRGQPVEAPQLGKSAWHRDPGRPRSATGPRR